MEAVLYHAKHDINNTFTILMKKLPIFQFISHWKPQFPQPSKEFWRLWLSGTMKTHYNQSTLHTLDTGPKQDYLKLLHVGGSNWK